MTNNKKFTDVRMDFFDEQTNRTSIDAWFTDDENEEGRVLGWFDHTQNEIVWANDTTEEEKADDLLQETIQCFLAIQNSTKVIQDI